MPLAQATVGEAPLAWATGDQVSFVRAMGGRAPLVGAKGSRVGVLSAMWCLFCDLLGGGGEKTTAFISETRGRVWSTTTRGL